MAYKATIEKVYTKQKTSKDGNPYTSLGILIEQNTIAERDEGGNVITDQNGEPVNEINIGDNWLSGFKNDWNNHWEEGMDVEFDVDVVNKNGKTYYNIEQPEDYQPTGKQGNHSEMTDRIEKQLDRIEKGLEKLIKVNPNFSDQQAGGSPDAPPANAYEDDNGIPFE